MHSGSQHVTGPGREDLKTPRPERTGKVVHAPGQMARPGCLQCGVNTAAAGGIAKTAPGCPATLEGATPVKQGGSEVIASKCSAPSSQADKVAGTLV